MKTLISYLLSFIIGVGLTILVQLISCNHNDVSNTVYVHDTTIVTRYITQVAHDTTIKWYEKPFEHQVQPDTVYWNSVDSVFIVKVQNMDVMLSVKKQGNDLYIYALNQNGKVLKQYVYHNVNSNFSATSQEGNIFVKSQLWYFDGVIPSVTASLPVEKISTKFYNDLNYSVGLETGLNFKEKFDLRLGAEHNFTINDTQLKLKGSYRIW